MKANPTSSKKNDFVTIKEVLSINGSGIVVAIMCMVIYTMVPMSKDHAQIVLRWVSLVLSFVASYIIYVNTNYGIPKDLAIKTTTVNLIALWIINGCFIFLSAAGVNYLNNSRDNSSVDYKVSSGSKEKEASIIPFLKDISWFPDAKIEKEIGFLKKQIAVISKKHSDIGSIENYIAVDSMFRVEVYTTDVNNKPLYNSEIIVNFYNPKQNPTDFLNNVKFSSDVFESNHTAVLFFNVKALTRKSLFINCYNSSHGTILQGEQQVPTASLSKKSSILKFHLILLDHNSHALSQAVGSSESTPSIDSGIFNFSKEEMKGRLIMPNTNKRLLALSSGDDEPIITIEHGDSTFYKGFLSNQGGITFWTDCLDCDWIPSVNDLHDNLVIASRIPQKKIFKSVRLVFAGAPNSISIKNKAGRNFEFGEFKVKPHEILFLKISKKPF